MDLGHTDLDELLHELEHEKLLLEPGQNPFDQPVQENEVLVVAHVVLDMIRTAEAAIGHHRPKWIRYVSRSRPAPMGAKEDAG